MRDYVHEVNTALEINGSDRYFESMDEVEEALKEKQKEHRQQGLKYSGVALTFLGTGVISDNYSDLLDELNSDDAGRILLTGGLAASLIPAYLGNQHKNDLDTTRNILNKIEREEYEDIELAYQIVNVLDS